MITSCKYCSEAFTARTNRKLFCSDRCKVRYNRENKLTCFYCGDLASTRDHVTPHCISGFERRVWSNLDYVNCCKDCNTLLGPVDFKFFSDKVGFLENKFTKKYKLDKARVQWSEEELEELSDMLALSIKDDIRRWNDRQVRRDHMRLRIMQCRALEAETLPKVTQDTDDD